MRLSRFPMRQNLKGELYGIEPSTRNSKIWPTRKEVAPSVPKNILLNLNRTRTRATLFQSITDVSTTALFRITFKNHELKNSNNSYHAARLFCQLSQFCPPLGCATSLTSTGYFQVLTVLPLAGRPNFAVSRGRFNPIQCPFKLVYKL